jgi:hypothetical protein
VVSHVTSERRFEGGETRPSYRNATHCDGSHGVVSGCKIDCDGTDAVGQFVTDRAIERRSPEQLRSDYQAPLQGSPQRGRSVGRHRWGHELPLASWTYQMHGLKMALRQGMRPNWVCSKRPITGTAEDRTTRRLPILGGD